MDSSYSPKLLRANLSTGKMGEETIPQSTLRQFIGGRGLGIKYLYQELAPKTEPLGPANKLIFSIGPLAGTGALSFSRWIVTTKSPLTDTYFRSVGGADFGAWLRFAGLDMVIIEGQAPKPVYLYIEDGRCEIRDAHELWGLDTARTQQRLKEVHGDGVRAVCIGPAGEKLVRFASILSDRRTAARGGVGAVMGAKNLKAIAINPSARRAKLPNPGEFKALIKQQAADQETDAGIGSYRAQGTLGTVQAANVIGVFPTRNFREGHLDGWENISAPAYAKIKIGDHGCYGCPVRCGKIHRVTTGSYAGATNEGPEYETIWAFAGSIASPDLEATVAFDVVCDDLGLDTMSAGVTIGFAYELFEKGIIDRQGTGGLDLTYGNHAAAVELARRIGNRQGLGDILAEGTRRAAAQIGKGTEGYAMQIKGLELAGYDPRGAKRQGLSYATSPLGGSHNIGYMSQEIYGSPHPRPVDRFADEGYTDILKLAQDRAATWETGIACSFAQPRMRVFTAMLASATGISEFGSAEYLFAVGERIFNLERAFNIREGFSRRDDSFPRRMTTEPLNKAGPSEGQILRKPDALLDEYYRFRGWDKDGVPTPDKLKELGLEEITKDMGG